MIVIVDYGIGNLASIGNMFRRIGTPAVISGDPAAIATASKLILPGVGAFDHAMRRLREGPLLAALERRALRDRVPTLGLCLGAQLLSRGSEEGTESGLGWIDADTIRFDATLATGPLSVPHMCWSNVTPTREHPLLRDDEHPVRFYFAHSYHLRCNDPDLVIGTAFHGYDFPAAVARENVMGVQFHPEKSHVFGMRLLQNFAALPEAPAATSLL